MNVLIIGNGGREHAIAESLNKSPLLTKLYIANGNYGTSKIAVNVDLNINHNHEILSFSLDNQINLVIIGPEHVLANGLVDVLEDNDILVLGPRLKAAQIETSKEFAKELMLEHNIPSASYQRFDDYIKALDYILKLDAYPIVIKYDGLASGKGVFITKTLEESKDVLDKLLQKRELGNDSIIIEEFLEGDEFTLLALVNGENVYPFQVARDFKRIGVNDTGLNTGGMGAICPYDKVSPLILNKAHIILKTTAKALKDSGNPFKGVLYGGFITKGDDLKVIEFNARFGDPETECVLNNLDSDLLEHILNLLNDKQVNMKFKDQVSCGVVLSAPGYPEHFDKYHNINEYMDSPYKVYHMASDIEDNNIISTGGRVLMIVNSAPNKKEAFNKIYDFLKDKKTLYYRSDLNKY
ncbi:MAG: phosphoribosylamine--glycine ligase [Erysipelotrichales bacterium]